VNEPIRVGSAPELAELLRARSNQQVRLLGRGTRQDRLPAAPAGAQRVSLARLDRIVRLEPDDLTCSVEPGLPREALDAALAKANLVLPCSGGGTIGGLFAADPIGAAVPGAGCPRSLLLGIEAVLADGTAFKAGARVVKSVAGFDLHKLFVGSRGRLFAATLLHLKLRPRPPESRTFANTALDATAALRLFAALRASPTPPGRLHLRRDAGGFAVTGSFAGRASFVRAMFQQHALVESMAVDSDHLGVADGQELLAGLLPPSRLPALLGAVAANAPMLVRGTGSFEVVLAPAAIDALLAALPGLDGHGEIAGGTAARRGCRTPLDAGALRLQQGLAQALDPREVFA
jgi:FAD/FMN-containing dehydrogenase